MMPFPVLPACLFALAPSLVAAQILPDSVHVVVEEVEYPSYVAPITGDFFEAIGPLPLVQAEPSDACAPITNPEALDGNIAFIRRGNCFFDEKIERCGAAGAVAVVVMNNDAERPDSIFAMGGRSVVTPADGVMVSYNSGQALLGVLSEGPTDATLVPVRPVLPTVGVIDTDVVETALYDNGTVGRHQRYSAGAPGFTFKEGWGLGSASFLLGRVAGVDTVVVYGYDGQTYNLSEFEPIEEVRALDAPFPPPFTLFDGGYETVFAPVPDLMTDISMTDISVEVTARAYGRMGDPYAIFDYTVTNTSGAPISALYAGLFADFDVGDFGDNLGGFDAEAGLLYVFDNSGDSPNYFGAAALFGGTDAEVSGWALDVDLAWARAFISDDSSAFRALTTPGTLLETPDDVRAVLGVGPLDLAVGASAQVQFALVAGASEAEILAHAAAAQGLYVSTEDDAPEEGVAALSPVYPNPAYDGVRLPFTLGEAAEVRVAVYDVLGRRVAVADEGRYEAGRHEVTLATSDLAGGVYLVWATVTTASEERVLTRRFTVVE